MAEEHVDVLIVGAGVSGIGAACHLTRDCPGKSYLVLERRTRMGGTWDLFRYPGVRSDSDMFTFGYSFRPWNDTRVFADGPSIRKYVEETAAEYGVDQHIRYGMHVLKASWSSAEGLWTLDVRDE
jgi:cation diffusion facilitator CzcD-associated flavoprotein CzcO